MEFWLFISLSLLFFMFEIRYIIYHWPFVLLFLIKHVTVGLPILGLFLWGSPYKRGFFCDDESLKHPFHDSTVRSWMLYIIGLVLPSGLVSNSKFMWIQVFITVFFSETKTRNACTNSCENMWLLSEKFWSLE